jgi:hypothetical protein
MEDDLKKKRKNERRPKKARRPKKKLKGRRPKKKLEDDPINRNQPNWL